MAQEIRIGMLGPLTVRVGGEQVPLPRSEVVRGLLGSMLLARGEPLSVPRLISMVWEDRAERTRPASVHVGIARLRGWLADTGLTVTVHREGPGYRLAHAGEVDLDRLAHPEPVAAGAAERCARLAAALRHYRGPVLADLTRLSRFDPLVREAERLVRRRCLELADAVEQAGVPELGIGALEVQAAADPYDEVVQARLVELLAAAGRQAAARQHYAQACRGLADDLGIPPSDRLLRAGRALPALAHR